MWILLERIAQLVRSFFGPSEPVPDVQVEQNAPPTIRFRETVILAKTPRNDDVSEQEFVVVRHQGTFRWALFRCPCPCKQVISLPLQAPHSPRWRVSVNGAGRPDLHPSVWRKKGCMSHFWIQDGRVFWTSDTGVAPWIAKPELYDRGSQRKIDFSA
ncbi:DUF6527 family protein [Bradyrhizobium sp. USDA 3311]